MKKILIILIKIFLILLLLFIAIIFYESNEIDMHIKEIVIDSKSNNFNTKFIFIFNDHNKSVYDETNSVEKIYGMNKNNIKITISNFKRVIILKKPGILKTVNDSIDVENSYVKLRGYMGIYDKEHKQFYVDKNGLFQVLK